MKSLSDSNIIYVNPVARISAQGRHKQVFVIHGSTGDLIPTTGMQKNKEFGVPSEYSFPYNHLTNKLQTGLDQRIVNPFKGLEPEDVIQQYGLSQEWLGHLQSILKQDNIKLQTKYEILDAVPYDHYTSDIAGGMTLFSTVSIAKANIVPPNFLQTFKIVLYDKPNRFTDETPRGRLAMSLIKIHPRIAKSKAEANPSKHDWYISEENEAQIEKLQRQDYIDDAKHAWVELKKSGTPYAIYQVASLLTWHDNRPLVKGKLNDDSVRGFIVEYLNDSSSYLMENISKFNKITGMLSNASDRERFSVMYLIQQAINVGVIDIRDGFYVWNSKAGTPNMYKHVDYDKFVSLIQNEYKNYNPEDRTINNWYRDLFEEVSSRGAWIEQ